MFVDVSNNNGHIDWDKAHAAGVTKAILKASEGTGFLDPFIARNVSECQRLGIEWGLYHFGRPDTQSGGDEARWFDKCIAPYPNPPLGKWLDLEVGSGNYAAYVDAFAAVCTDLDGLYFSPSWWFEHGSTDEKYARFGLWIADYGVMAPIVPAPWDAYTYWQYSSTGHVDGIPGNVDLNQEGDWFAMATEADLQKVVRAEMNRLFDALFARDPKAAEAASGRGDSLMNVSVDARNDAATAAANTTAPPQLTPTPPAT